MSDQTELWSTAMRCTRSLLAIVGIVALLALGGCAQPQRSAEEPVDVLGPIGVWGMKHTRICVINESSVQPTVTFDRKDSSWGEGVLERSPSSHDRACGEGSFDDSVDVRAIVKPGIEHDPPVLGYEFNGRNRFGLPPNMLTKQLFAAELYGVSGICGGAEGWGEGKLVVLNDGGPLAYVIERRSDSDFKEFVVTIRDNGKPETSGPFAGASRPCTGSDDSSWDVNDSR